MKLKRFLALFLPLLILTPVVAQEERSEVVAQEERSDVEQITLRVKRMTERLDLTEEQSEKLSTLLAAHIEENEASMAKLREDIKAILTPEQREKADEILLPDRQRDNRERTRRRSRTDTRRNERVDSRRTRGRDRGRDNVRRFPFRLSSDQREALGRVQRNLNAERHTFARENPEATEAEKRAFNISMRERLAEARDSILTVEQRLYMIRGMNDDDHSKDRFSLNLSEEQETKLSEAITTYMKARGAWRIANPDATFETRAEYFRQIGADLETAYQEILTPEQLEKLERRRDRRLRKQ